MKDTTMPSEPVRYKRGGKLSGTTKVLFAHSAEEVIPGVPCGVVKVATFESDEDADCFMAHYAAMQSRIARLEEAITNTLKYMDSLDGMIGPFHPNDFGAAHLRAALEEK